jgi:hypothetical protein
VVPALQAGPVLILQFHPPSTSRSGGWDRACVRACVHACVSACRVRADVCVTVRMCVGGCALAAVRTIVWGAYGVWVAHVRATRWQCRRGGLESPRRRPRRALPVCAACQWCASAVVVPTSHARRLARWGKLVRRGGWPRWLFSGSSFNDGTTQTARGPL